ncbi:dockerin type I domain-containing protein [Holophaga foetida]|uniref:dockerin type I domain-containing protein n=1 Tax=Holophaga foetida TaxID=35839 RepID=UPI0002471CA6|nr:dockerin type I domain-containing protein [Holophaga foetida]
MPTVPIAEIRKSLPLILGLALSPCFGFCDSPVNGLQRSGTKKLNVYCTVNTLTASDGKIIKEVLISGPPAPPSGFEVQRQAVSLPTPNSAAGINALTVPAFTWELGCSAVSGAMIAGYYDRNGFPNMYTGPANSGVMPLTDSSWATWVDTNGDTYPNNPLIASHNGVDGRTTKGTIDDYWVLYDSAADDPYITGAWTQHAWSDAIGDYMKTSQSAFDNTDGSTTFYNYSGSADRLTCDVMAYYSLPDGTLGRKRFYEARGYICTECYNQPTDNQITGGFSYAQYKAEIDAGRPVMLNLEGHTVVGVGYNDSSSNLVYIHDTWDESDHTMTWGGSYSSMALLSVSIVNLSSTTSIANLESFTPTSALEGASVTLTGTAFTGATSVTFGGVAATFTVNSATQITATVPIGAVTGKISVTTPAGVSQSSLDFTVITYDLNVDGSVDLSDLARLARYFGTSRATDASGFQPEYDLNGDGTIDESDATLLFNNLD